MPAKIANQLPAEPSTYEVLCETISRGAAVVIGKAVDSFEEKPSPSIIASAVSYYEENKDFLKELNNGEKIQDLVDFLDAEILKSAN